MWTPLRRRQARQPCSDERRGALCAGSDTPRRAGGRSSVAQNRHLNTKARNQLEIRWKVVQSAGTVIHDL
eukprot:725027-Prymnesium_polylepis.1